MRIRLNQPEHPDAQAMLRRSITLRIYEVWTGSTPLGFITRNDSQCAWNLYRAGADDGQGIVSGEHLGHWPTAEMMRILDGVGIPTTFTAQQAAERLAYIIARAGAGMSGRIMRYVVGFHTCDMRDERTATRWVDGDREIPLRR